MAIRNMFIEPEIRLHLDYFNQLIYGTFTREQWLQREQKLDGMNFITSLS